MDPELKRLLEQNIELSKQNNKMLRAMRRDAMIGLVWKIIVWVGLIILPLYFYQQYFAPAFSQLGLPSSFTEMQKLLDSYKTKQ